MNTRVICDYCKNENSVGKENLKQETVSITEKYRIKVNAMYYVCSKCGRINAVQIDDDITTRIKDSLTKTIMEAIEAKRNGEKVGKKINGKRIRLTESLKKEREKLLKKYKENVEIILTIKEKGVIL